MGRCFAYLAALFIITMVAGVPTSPTVGAGEGALHSRLTKMEEGASHHCTIINSRKMLVVR